jgi:hypothetical protein
MSKIVKTDKEVEFPICDYCHNFEDCPYAHNWKLCGAEKLEDTFDFFDIVKCEDWIGLFKWNEYIKENPLESMIEYFEDELGCEDEIFDYEILTEERQTVIGNAIRQCKTNEEIIETVKYHFNNWKIQSEYTVYHYELI